MVELIDTGEYASQLLRDLHPIREHVYGVDVIPPHCFTLRIIDLAPPYGYENFPDQARSFITDKTEFSRSIVNVNVLGSLEGVMYIEDLIVDGESIKRTIADRGWGRICKQQRSRILSMVQLAHPKQKVKSESTFSEALKQKAPKKCKIIQYDAKQLKDMNKGQMCQDRKLVETFGSLGIDITEEEDFEVIPSIEEVTEAHGVEIDYPVSDESPVKISLLDASPEKTIQDLLPIEPSGNDPLPQECMETAYDTEMNFQGVESISPSHSDEDNASKTTDANVTAKKHQLIDDRVRESSSEERVVGYDKLDTILREINQKCLPAEVKFSLKKMATITYSPYQSEQISASLGEVVETLTIITQNFSNDDFNSESSEISYASLKHALQLFINDFVSVTVQIVDKIDQEVLHAKVGKSLLLSINLIIGKGHN